MEEDQKTMTRREREREQHRQEILEAAEAVFSERGVMGVTIEDIAKKAQFAVGSIYNFFSGRDELIHQTFLRTAEARNQQMEEQVMPYIGEPMKALLALVQLWIEHHRLHGSFLRAAFVFAMAKEWRPGMPQVTPDMLALFSHYESMGHALFREGVERGCFHAIPPEQLMLIFEGTSRSYLMKVEREQEGRAQAMLVRELFNLVYLALSGKQIEEGKYEEIAKL